jgi:hypothetical protein
MIVETFANVWGEFVSIPTPVLRYVAGMDDDTRLSRKEAAHALTEVSYRITVPTLATLASCGLGPSYIRFGKRTIYRWGDRTGVRASGSAFGRPWKPATRSCAAP